MNTNEKENIFCDSVRLMFQVNLNVYSRRVLGNCSDPSVFSRKLQYLIKLSLCDPISRNLKIADVSSLVAMFRIVCFNSADLVICKDMALTELLQYENPCNLRAALRLSLAFSEEEGIAPAISEVRAWVNRSFAGSPQAPITSSARESDWFKDAHPLQAGVIIVEGSYGSSIHSTRSFRHSEPVITLGLTDTISIVSPFRDPRFPSTSLLEAGLHPDMILLLYLIHLRKESSVLENPILRDFFASQPNTYGTMYELPESVLTALDEPELTAQVRQENETLHQFCSSLQPAPLLSELLWAKSLCTSRSFSLPLPPISPIESQLISDFYPDGRLTTLLPIIHCLNHDFSAQLDTPVLEGDCVVVKAFSDIAPGAELFLTYGGFTNKQLILNYGFYIKGNPYDTFDDGNVVVRRGSLTTGPADEVTTPQVAVDVAEEYKGLVQGYLADREVFRRQYTLELEGRVSRVN